MLRALSKLMPRYCLEIDQYIYLPDLLKFIVCYKYDIHLD